MILHYNVVVCVVPQDLQTIKAKTSRGIACYLTPLDRSDAATPDVFSNVTFNVRLSFSSFIFKEHSVFSGLVFQKTVLNIFYSASA